MTSANPTFSGLPIRKNPFFCIPVLALLDTLLIELLNHKAFTLGLSPFLSFVRQHPLALLVDFLLLMLTLIPAFFLRRRAFWYALVSALWLSAGAANGFILLNRMTPFTTADLTVFDAGLETLPNYLSTNYIVLLAVSVVLVAAGLIWLLLRGPRCNTPRKQRLVQGVVSLAVTTALLCGGWTAAFRTEQLSTVFSNLAFAYRDYGFAYCFLQTWLNKGIRMPVGYSQAHMQQLRALIGKGCPPEQAQTDVNVIYVQLESFIDPALISGLQLSGDPAPNWHRLKSEYTTGTLTVPVLGAGTANTEFEVLAGMSTRFFGPGEYAYKPCMLKNTAESTAYDLSALGYATHAVHNHRAMFYSRNIVYSNLGFEDFTPLELMPKLQKTPNNWAKDEYLTTCILDALDSTEAQPDFVFTVTVQMHGSYPDVYVLDDPAFLVTDLPDNLDPAQTEYYVNELSETDRFIGALTNALEARDERCIVVFYGDHLPALNLTAAQMQTGSLYETEYLIWDNFGLPQENRPLTAYQLSAAALEKLGISQGLLTRFHQTCSNSETYLADLRAIEYDLLYGRRYLTDGADLYEPTDMKLGIRLPEITQLLRSEKYTYVMGSGFNGYCKVAVDGEPVSTKYIGPNMLRVKNSALGDDFEALSVQILDKHKELLAEVTGDLSLPAPDTGAAAP